MWCKSDNSLNGVSNLFQDFTPDHSFKMVCILDDRALISVWTVMISGGVHPYRLLECASFCIPYVHDNSPEIGRIYSIVILKENMKSFLCVFILIKTTKLTM